MFDHVLFLAQGRTAFLGPTESALKFFETTGYRCPAVYNPADFLIQTLAIVPGQEQECKQRAESICDAYENSDFSKDLQENGGTLSSGTGVALD